jgi:hypothetical protein
MPASWSGKANCSQALKVITAEVMIFLINRYGFEFWGWKWWARGGGGD